MKISVDKSRNLCEVLLSAADIYIEKFYTGGAILLMKHSAGSHVVYRFDWPMRTYFFP